MNTELHERTVLALVKLVDVLDCDELSLICWHCGVKTHELMPTQDTRRPVLETTLAAEPF